TGGVINRGHWPNFPLSKAPGSAALTASESLLRVAMHRPRAQVVARGHSPLDLHGRELPRIPVPEPHPDLADGLACVRRRVLRALLVEHWRDCTNLRGPGGIKKRGAQQYIGSYRPSLCLMIWGQRKNLARDCGQNFLMTSLQSKRTAGRSISK